MRTLRSLSDISTAHANTDITGSATMMRAKTIIAVSFVIFPYASIRQDDRHYSIPFEQVRREGDADDFLQPDDLKGCILKGM